MSQLDAIAVKLTIRTPQASGSGGPSVDTHAALWLTTSLPPPLMILPATEPSTMTFAPGSIVKLPRRFPRTCKKQFSRTIVSLTTELCISNEPATRIGASPAFCDESIAAFDTSTRHPPTEWCEWLLRLSGLAARCAV